MALKMATGSGKTVVMAMLIAWQVLNKLANPQDARFSDTFLIVTPGITIRDRLRVLCPTIRRTTTASATWSRRIAGTAWPGQDRHHQLPRLSAAREDGRRQAHQGDSGDRANPTALSRRRPTRWSAASAASWATRRTSSSSTTRRTTATAAEPDGEDVKLTGDDRKEAEKREEEARVWISGLEAVKAKIGVKAVYDLSATPFFLRGSGYPEGTLFPWVVSDFSLIDAIEAGIVKVPRVPVADDSMTGDQPTYRDLWLRIREDLPKKGRKTEPLGGEPKLPAELQGALHSLYSNYEKYYRLWEQNAEGHGPRAHAAGVHRRLQQHERLQDGLRLHRRVGEAARATATIVQAGQLPIFRNDDEHGGWLHRPNTILVDSQQLESGEAMSDDFKKIAAREIEEFKAEYRIRFPGRDAENLTDEDLLREVMNKVYVVQTITSVIERCLLMTTDPGDLVLDPTCGSGTTAYVAEQWGRRWITCDTSRVALALARTRLMAAKYPYYLLADSPAGIQKEAELTGKMPPPHKTDAGRDRRSRLVRPIFDHQPAIRPARDGQDRREGHQPLRG